MLEIEYYDDSWDSNYYFVCINRYHIFAANRTSKSPTWEYIDPRGYLWDAFHQRIYRNQRSDKIDKEEIPKNFPPTPDSIPESLLNLPPLPPPPPLLLKDYPVVKKYFENLSNHSAEIYVVLLEDLYESLHGDGKFHYMDSVFIQKTDALKYCAEKKTEFDFYHLRICNLKIESENISCEVASRPFDHISDEGILVLMTALLSNQTNLKR
jgi:hypothetical protein